MADTENRTQEQGEDGKSYVPASFEKRAAAWMGIAYMVMLLFIINFSIFTGGRQLPGTFPLFLIPVCTTLTVVVLRRLKSRALPGGIAGGVLALIACIAGIAIGLGLGVPALLAAISG